MFFGIFIPKIGQDEPILTNIFKGGWNHQPDEDGDFPAIVTLVFKGCNLPRFKFIPDRQTFYLKQTLPKLLLVKLDHFTR